MTTIKQEIELLPFYCPIESAIHPQAAEIEEQAQEWLAAAQFPGVSLKKMFGTNSAEFMSRFAPYGIADNIFAATLWVYWGFAFDDVCCDSGSLSAASDRFIPVAAHVQRALELPHQPGFTEPYALALHDVGMRLRACATPIQMQRFINAHRQWLHGVMWQIANKASNIMPDVNDYLIMRLGSAGGPPTMALLEICTGLEVPASEMDSPAVRAISECAYLVASLDNDLHSYQRERYAQHTGQNLVAVLMHHQSLGVDHAVHDVVAIRDRMMTLFLRLKERLDRTASEALASYLDNLAHSIRGNIDWALGTPRYFGLPSPGWTQTPLDSSLEPLPYPTVSWWWDYL